MRLDEHLDGFAARDWQTRDEGEVRFAMVGLGWWTREKAIPAVADSTLGTVTVVVSGTAAKAREVAAATATVERGLTYDAFRDGEAAEAYDAVYVSTPNALHLPYVEAAAAHGKAVLCEKPMEATVERAERLVEACDDAGVPLMVAYRMQTEPAVRRARELVADGAIGEPALVHGSMTQPLLELVPDPEQWRLDPDLAGYGTSVMDIGLYPLNTARFVLGREPERVRATTVSLDDAFEGVPDERATFAVEYDGGVLGSYSASQNAHQSSHLRITGTAGEIRLDPAFFPWTDRGFAFESDDGAVDLDWEQLDQMTEEFDYFADRVLAGEPPHPDGRHGLVDMRTLAAIYEAAESGRAVAV